MWLNERALKEGKRRVSKGLDCVLKNVLAILGSIIDMTAY